MKRLLCSPVGRTVLNRVGDLLDEPRGAGGEGLQLTVGSNKFSWEPGTRDGEWEIEVRYLQLLSSSKIVFNISYTEGLRGIQKACRPAAHMDGECHELSSLLIRTPKIQRQGLDMQEARATLQR